MADSKEIEPGKSPAKEPAANQPRRRRAGSASSSGSASQRKGKSKGKGKGGKRRSPAAKLGRAVLLCIDIMAGLALLATGYAGNVSPLKYGGAWGILGLAFPIVLALVTALFILQLFVHRRGAVVLAVFAAFAGGPILTYSPFNIRFGASKPEPGDSTFTLLSYNVANLLDQRTPGTYDSTYSAMVSYILAQNADIVCLSESEHIGVNPALHITAAQYDSLQSRYPHIIVSGRAQATLSRFPIQPIHTSVDRSAFGAGDFGMYRVTLPGGKLLTLFNVHLQSLGLNSDDKNLYMDLTELRAEDMNDVRSQLLSKISAANVVRARQTQMLLGIIRHYGGPNVIVCGDFNDVPDCYSIRAFETAGFSSVYPELGFGPMVTFNANRFYFCIDHVLYRGDLRPLDFHKGTLRASDHYPLTTVFEVL